MLEACSTVIALSHAPDEIVSARKLAAVLIGEMAGAGGEHDSF
ncbi:hypothetical protein [Salipiger bermudensis]|nr:hypothetical protein [Salipiger bermudensis]